MSSFELALLLVGAICIFVISYGLFLMKPHSEPIIIEGKIVDKYMRSEVKCYAFTFPSGYTSMPVTIQTFNLVILSEKGFETKIRVRKEKYNSLEVDDSIEFTEYSWTRKIIKKKEDLHSQELIAENTTECGSSEGGV